MSELSQLISEIKKCRICEPYLELGANPVLSANETSKILIVGQAPGTKVHKTGIPWNDPSGDTLREWLKIDKSIFYDSNKVSIVPMGFCYPGKGKTGDLPPRKECAETWHNKVLSQLPNLELILLVGQYAQNYYLVNKFKTLTENVKNFHVFDSPYFPLPHPSPRNRIWLKKNSWFVSRVLPILRSRVKLLLDIP